MPGTLLSWVTGAVLFYGECISFNKGSDPLVFGSLVTKKNIGAPVFVIVCELLVSSESPGLLFFCLCCDFFDVFTFYTRLHAFLQVD